MANHPIVHSLSELCSALKIPSQKSYKVIFDEEVEVTLAHSVFYIKQEGVIFDTGTPKNIVEKMFDIMA